MLEVIIIVTVIVIVIPLVSTSIIQRDGCEHWVGGWTVADPPAPPTVLGDPLTRALGVQTG